MTLEDFETPSSTHRLLQDAVLFQIHTLLVQRFFLKEYHLSHMERPDQSRFWGRTCPPWVSFWILVGLGLVGVLGVGMGGYIPRILD